METMTATTTQTMTERGTYTVDQAHSQIGFRVRHLGFARVAGTFADYDVTVEVDPDDLSTLEARLTAQTASIDTGNTDRDAHLRSDDFFASETWPEMTFESTAVRNVDENRFVLVGTLSLHGVTKEVELTGEMLGRTTDPWGNDRIAFEATTTLNRKEFGLTWNQALETGGLLVGENVEVVVELQLVRNSDDA